MLWICLLLFNIGQPFAITNQEIDMVFQNIPKQIDQWTLRSKDEIFDRKTIFKHINGGAELYLAYDFQKALVRRYTDNTGMEILVDVYDMGSAQDAYGVFSSEYDRGDAGVGQGSEYADGLLRFWKNRYFVSVYAMGNDDKNISIPVKKIGHAIAAAIRSKGKKPDMLRWLPATLPPKMKVRFFHTDLLLQKHLYIADENILDLSIKTDCLLLELPSNTDQLSHILLIQYPKKHDADEALKRFINHIDGDTSSPVRHETLGWTWAQANQKVLTIALNAPGKQQAIDMLTKIAATRRK